MERLEHRWSDIVPRMLSVMAADVTSPLDRDERKAVICWLQGIPSNVVILLPHDLMPKMIPWIEAHHPNLLLEATLELIGVNARFKQQESACPFESPLEIDFYLTWQELDLPLLFPLSPQYTVKDGKYRLDFAFPPLKVGIELDGYTYHSDREIFTKDRQRQRELEADGWRIIRFSGEEIRADVVKCVKEAAHFLSIQQYQQSQRKD